MKSVQEAPVWFGPVLVVGGILMAIFGRPAPDIPQFVGYFACGAFVAGGLAVIANRYKVPYLGAVSAFSVAVCILSVITWAGFAPGERACRSSLSFLGFMSHDSSLSCKAGFAVVSVFFWLLFGVAVWKYVRKRK
jgi:hypothetical protein